MAKKPEKKLLEKKTFDLDTFLETEGMNSEPKDKELSWVPLSKAWHDALKLPGFPRGYVSLVRGYSNTGKSTAIYEAIVGCQKLGVLAVVFETEGNWNWEHAKQIGVELREIPDEETGELTYKPKDFILLQGPDLVKLYASYDHQHSKMGAKPLRYEPVVEDISYYMHNILDKQQEQ